VRIALVCPYDLGAPGGVQDQVAKLSIWLGDLGHETVVIGPGAEGPPGAVLVGSVKVVRANAAATPISLDPKASSRIRDAVEGCDVVHIHEPLMPLVSLSASRISDRPTVGTFHADPPSWARTGYSALAPVLRQVLAKIDVITTVSPVSRSAIQPFADARVIPNGIDTSAYGGREKVPGRVVFLGRDDPRKGLDVLLAAWPEVFGANSLATLHILGAERAAAPAGVSFLGRVSEEAKHAELAAAEVFVAPNLGGESFGIIVAEGMASLCAVVASGIPAFLHVLGGTGAIIDPGDIDGLSTNVIDLLKDDTKRNHLAVAAAARAQRFDGTHVAGHYVAAYEDAITKHRR
jgi:phosphatidylinositol alpha-mannosyltransferase